MAADGADKLMKKDENPISVYAKVSQLAFVILTPLLLLQKMKSVARDSINEYRCVLRIVKFVY